MGGNEDEGQGRALDPLPRAPGGGGERRWTSRHAGEEGVILPRHGLERGQHMIDGDEDLPEGPDEDAGRRRRRMRVVQFLLPLIAVWGTYKACFKVGKKVVRKFGDDALQHGDDVKRHGDELLDGAKGAEEGLDAGHVLDSVELGTDVLSDDGAREDDDSE